MVPPLCSVSNNGVPPYHAVCADLVRVTSEYCEISCSRLFVRQRAQNLNNPKTRSSLTAHFSGFPEPSIAGSALEPRRISEGTASPPNPFSHADGPAHRMDLQRFEDFQSLFPSP
jgi:hypothetical protein